MGGAKGQRGGDSHGPAERIEELLLEAERGGQGDFCRSLRTQLGLWQEAFELRLVQCRQEYRQLRLRMDQVLEVYAISEKIGSSFEPQHIFDALLSVSGAFFPVANCGVFVECPKTGRLLPRAVEGESGLLQRELERLWREGMVQWAWREEQPIAVNGAAGRPWILAPLVLRGVPLGLYLGQCAVDRDQLDADLLDLLGAVVRQAALALENARLYTELEKGHSRLKASQNQLIDAARQAALGQMAGSVAHEVNNPLQNMLGRVQLMRLENRGDSRVDEGLALIEANIKRIAHIAQGLLGFARTRAVGDGRRTFTAAEALNAACQLTGGQLEVQLIELAVDCPDQLPLLRGDLGELVQVFINLINNAQNAMPKGGNLHISARQRDDRLEFSFSDTGQGIAKRDVERLFEPYFSTRLGKGGTGLGLAVSQKIVAEMGGSIKVASTVGAGATFTVSLPAEQGIGGGGGCLEP